ncbi:helix-turn-helix transcriptional regulator [Anaeromyxobacter dehalogenans]|uniref:helix-turn-helix transcriptional regulator n=1 Tax=Anaeromyxobacter dehalogenans TaxID=161493 RepID=UPI0009D6EC72
MVPSHSHSVPACTRHARVLREYTAGVTRDGRAARDGWTSATARGAFSGRHSGTATLGTSRLPTIREVAERLRVSRATVYRLVAEGRIPSVRVSSGAIRVAPDWPAYRGR